jgi:transcriptional regulator with XRE-family HTH domain
MKQVTASETPTDLGTRIKEAADLIGGLEKLAQNLNGISRRTLSDYVSNKSEPKVSTLVDIVRSTGVSVQWLVGGTGFKTAAEAAKHYGLIDPDLMSEISEMVVGIHAEGGIRLSKDATLREAVNCYNRLLQKVENPADVDEIRSLYPWLSRRLKSAVDEAASAPGTGKRSA